jgi:RNA polymerase sigma-70 factor (ECF subfamily)
MNPRARAEAAHLRLVDRATSPDDRRLSPEERRTPAPTLDDAQLIAALREGDPAAAASFHDRARPVVDRTIHRLLGRRDRDHDDLAQMSMIQLIGSVDRFRGECALDGWISTVTAHTVFKHLRRRKTESRFFGPDEVPEARENHDLTPDRRAALRGVVARVRQHLDALESNKAWTFLLHEVCGYDLREIAEITEVSVAAAQQRLSRGRRELLARMHEDPELVDLLRDMGEGRR